MRTEHLNFSGARCLCPKYILKGGVGKRVQCRIAGAGKVVLVILH